MNENAGLEAGRRAARPLSLRRGELPSQMGRRSEIGSPPKTAIFIRGAVYSAQVLLPIITFAT